MLPFDKPEYLAINKARLSHLASLGLDLTNKTVLEIGAGIGQLTGFFEERDCRVVSVEGRLENIREYLRKYPERSLVWRISDFDSSNTVIFYADLNLFFRLLLPVSDIVFCYGFLYHIVDPSFTLSGLSEKCSELFLLESCVNHTDDGLIRYVSEPVTEPDQSLDGRACRPARDWIMAELRKHFDYVYLTATQPRHDDFPLEWPSQNSGNSRAVFVASRRELNLPALTTKLLTRQVRH